MVRVNGDVKPHQLDELGVITESKERSKVLRVIFGSINGREFTRAVSVAVNPASDVGQFGDAKLLVRLQISTRKGRNVQIHAIFEDGSPVLLLRDALSISLGESTVVVESSNSHAELAHRVQSSGASINDILHEIGNLSTSSPIRRKGSDLLIGRNFTSDKQPEKGFRKRFRAPRSFREFLLAFWDGLSAESNTLLCGET
jgi:hypothetical protein